MTLKASHREGAVWVRPLPGRVYGCWFPFPIDLVPFQGTATPARIPVRTLPYLALRRAVSARKPNCGFIDFVSQVPFLVREVNRFLRRLLLTSPSAGGKQRTTNPARNGEGRGKHPLGRR